MDNGELLCTPCLKVEILELTKSKNELQKSKDELQKEHDKTVVALGEAVAELNLMRKRLEALEKKMESNQISAGNDILLMKENIKSELLKEQDSRMIELIHELKLQDQKKLNLCISGICESDTSDMTILKNLFTTRLGLSNREAEKVVSCKRFSTKNNKPIIIVTFDCKEVRRNVLKNAAKLKNYRTSENTSVFISKDMTRKQQIEAYQLRNELKTQRERGNDVIIRNNKIVPRNATSNTQLRPRSNVHTLNDSLSPSQDSSPQARSPSPPSFSTPPSN